MDIAARPSAPPPVPPVLREVVVNAAPDRVFRAFTERMDAWWPRTHKIGKTEVQRVVLEPRVQGRWFEIGQDGAECNWGKVLVWEPPRRVVLAWQIVNWAYDPNVETEVEVTFTAEGPRATRVRLEHRNLERLGPATEAMRAAFESPNGWSAILARFVAAAA